MQILAENCNFVLQSTIFVTPSTSLTETRTEWVALQDPCDVKGVCGINSYCSSTAGNDTILECHCFPGFLFFDNTTNGKFLGCYRNFTDEEACSQRLKLSYSITTMDNMSLGIHPYSVIKLTQEACSKSCMDDCYCWVAVYSTGLCKLLKAPIIYAAHRKSGVTPTAHFKNDLRLDSLDTVEVVMALEEEFGFEIPDNEADKISTISHAVDFIASHPQAKYGV
ncbi:S-locus glycoprotein domain-containing protein [Tanacetum coccineum]